MPSPLPRACSRTSLTERITADLAELGEERLARMARCQPTRTVGK